MKISAKDIERWAETREAQAELPRLIRRMAVDRQDAKDRVLTDLRKRKTGGPNGAYAIRADSAAEAAALVCAALLEAEELSDLAVVVTGEDGWRFVERNPRLRVVVAARPEIAQRPAENVLTIVPVAAGDLASGYGGRDGEGFRLELLDLFADRITAAELDRFFGIVEALLVEPDPILELEADKRWMAQVSCKVRGESGLLIRSVFDALVKLAVRGRDYEGLATLNVDLRVERLVDRLLRNADVTRWLSLASHRSPLAEAAPGAFVSAIEVSLGRSDTPVLTLFSESVSADTPLGGGAWYYADLLWALESLAWSPRWMPRVATLLARMSRVQLPNNWSNRPLNSLLGIFRSWMPQTAATLDQRIAVLDKLISSEPDIAFQLMDRLLHHGHDIASPASKPDWRDDDAGVVGRPSGAEVHGILVAAADRMIGMATGNAHRVVRLIDKLTLLDAARADQVMDMAAAFTGQDAGDFDRELIRNELCEKLHWHLSYGKNHPQTSLRPVEIARWRELYQALAPLDSVIRHRWLFENG